MRFKRKLIYLRQHNKNSYDLLLILSTGFFFLVVRLLFLFLTKAVYFCIQGDAFAFTASLETTAEIYFVLRTTGVNVGHAHWKLLSG